MPDFRRDIAKRLAGMDLPPGRESEIVDELNSHLEDHYQQLLAGGLSADEAAALTREDLDDLARRLASVERPMAGDGPVLGARSTEVLADLWQDLRFGLRSLRKNPMMTTVAVITLALGIGANAAIFSFVYAILLRPLPYPASDQLVMVWESRPREGLTNNTVSPADFVDWQARQQVFQAMAAAQATTSMDLTGGSEPERVSALAVSATFFRVFGVAPALGRDFRLDEDRGPHRVVVLNHGLWQRRFGGDLSMVGRSITLGGEVYTVIGVMPAFGIPDEVFVPLDSTDQSMQTRTNHFLSVYARLKTGVTIAHAQQDMDRVSAQIQREVPQQNQGHASHVMSLHEQLAGDVRRPLGVLAVAVGLVLLMACTNVANLLLARGTAWQRELAIRLALGASRFRIVRQFSIECLWLAVLGLAAGLPVAVWSIAFLKSIAPINTPLGDAAGLDVIVVAFMIGIAFLTAVLSGLGPAFHAAGASPQGVLKDSSPTAGGSRHRLRQGLIVAQIALTFVLLTGAGLMVRTLWNVVHVEAGFDPENVITVPITLSRLQTDARPVPIFFGELIERLRALPGISSVGLTSHLPLSGSDSRLGIGIEGKAPAEEPRRVHWRVVSSDYFRAMGMRVLEGRSPTERDLQNAPPVVVINRTAANRYWGPQSPVGARVRIPGIGPEWREVVGVVEDVKHWGLASPVNPEAYLPGLRNPATLVMRTTQATPIVAASIRDQIRQLDANLPIATVQTMDQVVERSVTSPKFYVILLIIFAALAAVLAAAGIYGVVSYTVAQTTRDIGVRMALGARPTDVFLSVLGQGLRLAVISLAIGLAASLAMTRMMRSLLFDVSPTDPLTLLAVAVLTTGIALLSCYIPAYRAATVDPILALRQP